jgi:hypothetical protein
LPYAQPLRLDRWLIVVPLRSEIFFDFLVQLLGRFGELPLRWLLHAEVFRLNEGAAAWRRVVTDVGHTSDSLAGVN